MLTSKTRDQSPQEQVIFIFLIIPDCENIPYYIPPCLDENTPF